MRWRIVSWVLGLLAACAAADKAAEPVRERADVGDSRNLRLEGARLSAAPAAAAIAQAPKAPSAVARKVHHEGSIRLRATQPQRALEQGSLSPLEMAL